MHNITTRNDGAQKIWNEYKYRQQQQIAVLNKKVTEQQEIIEERDRAIEMLVHHSLVVQETKGDDELARLHHSNDKYAKEFLAQPKSSNDANIYYKSGTIKY